ncbi:uncharacterized protein LOC110718001 [Chenopodium quinoa]|uniref:uncharacterized protein LOC110718001 n=1 Tax=Chenopodium quinoa TaxID=63459 RepID=UPI000B793C7A|nr:uncharacterized protein LOC110718001 [Chenopodium quinoa]
MTAQPPRKLSNYSQPSPEDFPHLALAPTLEGVQFEIKPQFITMIERKQFSGAKGEDPNLHILDFCQYYNTIRRAGVTQDQIREILFPFYLCGKDKLWYNGLNRTALGHWAQECTSSLEKINVFQAYKQTSPYSNIYNAGFRNNQNMSYNSMNAPNPPPQAQQPQQRYYQPPHQIPQQTIAPPSDSGLSEIRTMLIDMQKQMQSRDAQIDSILTHNKIMDNQIAQLSSALQTRQQGALPSQPVQPIDHVNAITLRSCSKFDGPSMPKDNEPIITNIPNPDSVIPNIVVTSPDITPKKDKNQDKSGDVQKPVIKLLFPNRHLKSKLDKQFGKFLEVVKNLQVTIPFTESITQVPAYSKFMKEILTIKRSISEVETIAFTEECSAILQNKSPPKLKDPGIFSIPCHIGNLMIDKALCDLGASVSVMPLFVTKLNMSNLKATNITLQMADRSLKYPIGVLEDVPVRVGVIIDGKSGKLILCVGDENIIFNLHDAPKSPMLEEKCYSIDVVDVGRKVL